MAKDAITRAFPGCKVRGSTDTSGCGGDCMVAGVKDGKEVPVWKGPQSDLSDWSGRQEETLTLIINGLKKL